MTPAASTPAPPSSGGARRAEALRTAAAAAALALAVALVFGRTLGHDFLNYDDNLYVYDNLAVRGGLSGEGLRWSLQAQAANWHPLTWLSHMADVELHGLQPRGHHLTNLLLHLAATAGLFLALRALTGALWPSALTAALFGVHPLHVESVAWISERKDVLSGALFVLTLAAYRRYLARPGPARYAAVLLAHGLGLAAKPMLVTVPFLLLVLDWWPLGRLRRAGLGRLLAEKAPLLALSAASAALTLQAQLTGVARLEHLRLGTRLANAAVATATYLAKTVWPSRLAVLYPYDREALTLARVGLSLCLLAALTALAVLAARRRPHLAAGWLWFLGMLVPVSGLVQVGYQSMADRYTYLPLAGVFLAGAWSLPPRRRTATARAAWAAALAATVALGAAAHRQAGHWRDTLSLLGHTLEVAPRNYLIATNYGAELIRLGRVEEAVPVLEGALRISPNHVNALFHLGSAYFKQGRHAEATRLLLHLLRFAPQDAEAMAVLGDALRLQGRGPEAERYFREALRLDPRLIQARAGLAALLAGGGREAEARGLIAGAARSAASRARTRTSAGNLALARGDLDQAIASYREALRLDPQNREAQVNLNAALERRGAR